MIQCETLLDGAVVIETDGESVMGYKYYAQKKRPPAFLNLMRTWGESGAVKTLTKTATKPIDTVLSFMMVG